MWDKKIAALLQIAGWKVGRDLNDMSHVMAVMLLIMLLGVTVDRAVFHLLEKRIQRKWGLTSNE